MVKWNFQSSFGIILYNAIWVWTPSQTRQWNSFMEKIKIKAKRREFLREFISNLKELYFFDWSLVPSLKVIKEERGWTIYQSRWKRRSVVPFVWILSRILCESLSYALPEGSIAPSAAIDSASHALTSVFKMHRRRSVLVVEKRFLRADTSSMAVLSRCGAMWCSKDTKFETIVRIVSQYFHPVRKYKNYNQTVSRSNVWSLDRRVWCVNLANSYDSEIWPTISTNESISIQGFSNIPQYPCMAIPLLVDRGSRSLFCVNTSKARSAKTMIFGKISCFYSLLRRILLMYEIECQELMP